MIMLMLIPLLPWKRGSQGPRFHAGVTVPP